MTTSVELQREAIANQLTTEISVLAPATAEDPESAVRFPMSTGQMVREMADSHYYQSWPLDRGQHRMVGTPVHWMALVPQVRQSGLSMVEFGVARSVTGLPYDQEAESAVLRADIEASTARLPDDAFEFYGKVRGVMAKNAAAPHILRRPHHVFAALERRDDGNGHRWTQFIAAGALRKTVDVVQRYVQCRNESDIPVPDWMDRAVTFYDTRKITEIMVMTGLKAAIEGRRP